MKLLVFASTPPPHHGQSYMVQLLLDGLGGDQRKRAPGSGAIQCFHVNPRLSDDLGDIGRMRPAKAFRLARAVLEALWCRFRYGVRVLYCIPAIPLKGSIIRDVLLLPLLRPFFHKTVLHWHATGLGDWVDSPEACQTLAKCARFALKDAELAIATRPFNLADARKFFPRLAVAVPYGVPDPCPAFDITLAPQRAQRHQLLANLVNPTPAEARVPSATVKLLFMALCTEDKGLLDAVDAVHQLNTRAQPKISGLRFHLTVAGKFLNPQEEQKFRNRVGELKLENAITYAGFIDGEQKKRLLRESDVFCFPTYYSGESFPVVLIEAMAFGLPIVTTRWRGLSELFPTEYPGLVDIKRPDQVALGVLAVLKFNCSANLRKAFLENYTIDEHVRQFTKALLQIAPRHDA